MVQRTDIGKEKHRYKRMQYIRQSEDINVASRRVSAKQAVYLLHDQLCKSFVNA